MNNNDTINAANTFAIQLLELNAFISPEDTVCSVRARSGRIFTGASHMNVHAEVEAIQNMLAAGEGIVDEMVLISTQTRVQLLPCNNCVGYILSLHPENANCAVIMPDRAIRLADVGMFASPPPGMINQPFPGGPGMGMNGGAMMPPPVNPLTPPPVNPLTPPPVNPVPLRPQTPEPEPEPEEDDDDDEIAAANTASASGDILKSRVNSLLKVASDDDEEIDRLTAKKKRFGIFRK